MCSGISDLPIIIPAQDLIGTDNQQLYSGNGENRENESICRITKFRITIYEPPQQDREDQAEDQQSADHSGLQQNVPPAQTFPEDGAKYSIQPKRDLFPIPKP